MALDLRHKFLGGLAAFALAASSMAAAATPDPADWSQPIKPFRIAGDIYYVGSRGLAAYLIVTRDGAILLDGTVPENAALVERNIEAVGVPLHRVKLLLADHAHVDHVGALAQIKKDTGAILLASAEDRWALEHGRPRGDTTYEVRPFPAVTVDGVVRDGQVIRLGEASLTAHLTPGHTPGCTSWGLPVDDHGKREQVLFLCSVTVAGNVLAGNHAYPGIVADYRRTFAKLAGMKADILLTSHPEMADVFGRAARRDAGQADAFIDATALPTLVARSRAAFDKAMAAEPRR